MALQGPYSSEDLGQIDYVGGRLQTPTYWTNRLQEAAQNLLLTAWSEREFLKSNKERGEDLLRVIQAARDGTQHHLDEAIGELDYPASRALPTNAGPAAIVEAAESAAEIAGRGGRPLKRARRHFITFLAAMYLRLTGHWPALMNNPETHEAYGPFLDFCRVCIEPLIDPDALKDPDAYRDLPDNCLKGLHPRVLKKGLPDEIKSVVTRCRQCKRRHRHCRCDK